MKYDEVMTVWFCLLALCQQKDLKEQPISDISTYVYISILIISCIYVEVQDLPAQSACLGR